MTTGLGVQSLQRSCRTRTPKRYVQHHVNVIQKVILIVTIKPVPSAGNLYVLHQAIRDMRNYDILLC